MTAKKKSDAPGALALIEEAMHMLRLAPIGPLARYYIGTLPFVLGLLYFWADMSRDPYASRYCSIASAGLAFLYVWMKTWQSAYTRALGNVFFGRSPGAWSLKSALAAATKQAAIHSTGPLVFPVALLMTLPFAWVFAFYQNATVLDKGRGQGLRKLCRDAWKQAALAPAQNHLLLCVLFLFEFFVFLNLTAALFMAPHLLKQLIGIETVFTLSGGSAFNTTFLAVVFGLTHLCVDPILKAVYALRCFYGASIKSGDDIRASLKRCMTTAALLAPVLFSFTIIPSAHAAAGEPAGVVLAREGDAEAPLVSRRLNDSIERVLKRREFAWRAPRDKTPEEEPDDDGMIAQALAWLGDV
ncbi:MAG: hypothetical protein GY859_27155, partial [Desulfobacterales bacterium]|nr:hypothetical protein [Desulfobacterales bacterium]